ncbi:MAG: MATE family efflux transporter [Anaerolineae bacterium]|nr:MATE family efflux transporter [Anaerolineae bacterium]
MSPVKPVSITKDPIPRVLFQLVMPAFIAQLVFVAFNLSNTYFVGQLGTDELAVLGFTGTLGFFIQVLLMGIGNGTAVLIAHAIGRGEGNIVEKLLTSCMLLSAIIFILLCSLILLFDNTIFTWQGVEPELQPMMASYMRIWVVGNFFWLVPMVGNNAIRATGDSHTASKYTIIMVAINMVLDPFLILGWGPFPAMGINGAAITSLIARLVVAVLMVIVLAKNFRMLTFQLPEWKLVWQTWHQVLKISIPISLTKSIMPLSIGYITSLVALTGTEAVAARSLTGKLQSIAMSMIQAIIVVLPGFIGQNLGAGKIKRAQKAMHMIEVFIMSWGLLMWGLLSLIGPFFVGLFTDDPLVFDFTLLWVGIVPPFLGFLAMVLVGSNALNVLKKPQRATVIYLIRMLALNVPLAYVFYANDGLRGIFWARAISIIASGTITFFWLESSFKQMKQEAAAEKFSEIANPAPVDASPCKTPH